MSELDLMRFPLNGRRLIEASAGTGKTYSITALHLRALLGHGMAAPVAIDRILLLTFTEAATENLRARVRERITTARVRLSLSAGQAEVTKPDAFTERLVAELSHAEQADTLLQVATTLIDSAAIHTLHGFCMRALREQAFASGAPFVQNYMVDDAAQVRIAVADAWRRLMRHSDALVVSVLRARWQTPKALESELKLVLHRDDVELRGVPAGGLAAASATLHAALARLADFLRAPGQLDALLDKRAGLRREKGKDLLAQEMLAALHAWLRGAAPPYSAEGYGLRDIVLSCAQARQRANAAASADVEAMRLLGTAALEAIDTLPRAAFDDALAHARARLRKDKLEQGWIAADDLLRDMLSALQGRNGERFAAALRERYPIAMIDEFQDTDSVQWRILDAIYPAVTAAANDAPACVLIGDPKQSIYAFRGADVHSYLLAASTIGAQHKSELRQSYRASSALVRATNRLYRDRDGFLAEGIDYRDVTSALKDAPNAHIEFADADGPLPPLRIQWLPSDGEATGSFLQQVARATAAQIRALLDDGGIRVDGKQLAGKNIAVLVRDRREASLVRVALRQRGLDAAYQSQESVYASDAARDLRFALHAALVPEDETRLRALALTPLGNMDAEELVCAPLESPRWQAIAAQFGASLNELHAQGPSAWIRTWLRQETRAQRLLARIDGRRRLTDLRHLGELLDVEWRRTRSTAQLAAWLDARINTAGIEREELRQLRLDSDDDLITIRTLHGAKGLEYDLVFLPFAWRGRKVDSLVLYERMQPPAQGYRAYLELAKPDANALRRARLAEDLRLLYVGLTRAKRACFVCVANETSGASQSGLRDTALGHLLFPSADGAADGSFDFDTNCAALAERLADCPDILVAPLHRASRLTSPPLALAQASDVVVSPFRGHIRDDWRVSSYTAIVAGRHTLEPAPGVADEGEFGQTEPAVEPSAGGSRPDTNPPAGLAMQFRFPRGPAAGSLLHAVLERWGEPGDLRARVDGLVRGHGFARADIELGELLAWLTRVRELPLQQLVVNGETPSLATNKLYTEVEFVLPLRGGNTRALEAVLQRHGYADAPLAPQRWRGLLKGFMDVVFEWHGRYVILDYKSNHLGDHESDYTAAALQQAMRAHRYDLQLLIYAVALRRWLRARGVGDARPEGLYWFLRGIDAPGSGLLHHVPSDAVLDELDRVFNGGYGR